MQPVDEVKYDTQALENNTWQTNPYDFDPLDRPAILPHKSFGKYLLPEFYTQPGNDQNASCPQFVTEC